MSDIEEETAATPKVEDVLQQIQQRLSALELKFNRKSEKKDDSVVYPTQHTVSHTTESGTSTDTGAAATSTGTTERSSRIQKDFAAVKDAVSRVQLDSNLRLCEGPAQQGTIIKLNVAPILCYRKVADILKRR